MKITREADYAIRIVSYLSKQTTIVGAKQISEETDITQRFALKILRKLCISGILKSYKGNTGGYTLNKLPAEINMVEVIEAIEGKIAINECLESDFDCNKAGCSCATRKAFMSANEILVEALSQKTFDKL